MNTSLRPCVSVVLTNGNHPDSLRLSLHSITTQTLQNFEVWVIGDSQSGFTEQIVEGFGDSRIHWHTIPGVQPESRLINEGLRRARGEYIAYLSSDDLWLPKHLQLLVEEIERTNAQLVFSLLQVFPNAGEPCIDVPEISRNLELPWPTVVLHKRTMPNKILSEFTCLQGRNHKTPQDHLSLSANVVFLPVTTGLKFLSIGEKKLEQQQYYLQQLVNDPYVMIRELSIQLVRAKQNGYLQEGESAFTTILRKVARFIPQLRRLGVPVASSSTVQTSSRRSIDDALTPSRKVGVRSFAGRTDS